LDRDRHQTYAGSLQGYQSDSPDLDLQAAWRRFAEEFAEAWRAANANAPDGQHLWLGIPRHQRPASNDRLLGLDEGEKSADVIRSAAERQMAFVRKFASGDKSEDANLLLGQLSRARSTLLRNASSTPAPPEQPINEQPINVQPFNEQPINEQPINEQPIDEPEAELVTILDEPETPPEIPMAVVATPVAMPTATPIARDPASRTRRPKKNPLAVVIAAATAGIVVGLIVVMIAVRILQSDGVVLSSGSSTQPVNPATQPVNPAQSPPSNAISNRPNSNPFNSPATASVNPIDSEVESYIQRARRLQSSEIDLDELERYAAMARTAAHQSAIRSIRSRYTSHRSHLQRIDDARMMGDLIRIENAIRRVESNIRRNAADPNDSQIVFDALEELGKIPSKYPHHTQMSSSRMTMAKSMADRALQQLNDVEPSPSEDASTPTDPSSDPIAASDPPDASNPSTPDSESMRPEFKEPERASRKWTTAAGVAFEAFVEDVDADRVMFRRASDDRKASMAIDQLIQEDQKVLRAMNVDRGDARQYESTVTYVSKIRSNPEASIEPLRYRHLQFSDSPYGGWWSAVCLSEGRNRHQEASRLLLQVIRRIEDQQELDPDRHQMTLASACNNLAVCKLKDGEVDTAAVQLAKALDETPEEFPAAIHNGRQLISLAPQSGAWALKSSSKSKLEKALNRFADTLVSLPAGWFYSLDANVPSATDHGRSGYQWVSQSVPGDPVLKNHWCIPCAGTGKIPCTYGNCVRGAVVVKKRVQVAINQLTGEPIYGDKNFKETCPNCGGAAGFDCKQCTDGKIP